ncbi:uncharacterized protein [Primulina eburnea]|uniref:uncharacterized protein n=1 Tax=Primulina eburnea TaxID=1245227 RepID=UPI003C6BE89C
MSMRKSMNGRPSGTDGSDFSYRMVVDSRYKKVARGRSRLSVVIFTQAIIQFVAALVQFQTTPKGVTIDKLSLSPAAVSFISLLVGEIGRKRNRVNLLKLYLFGSSVATLISVVCLLKSQKSFEIIKDFSRWEVSRLEVLKIAFVVLGFLTQMYAITATTTLIHNMAPPKRTS